METCTVTKKGQVTIPKRLRQLLDIRVGEKVTFDIENEKIVIRKLVDEPIEDLVGLGKGIFEYSMGYQRKIRDEWQ
jgi:AbrB family looped-hinge helix DNA binding protein